MPEQQEFVKEFEEEAGSFRNDYDTVNALLLYWEDDDLNVDPEVKLFKQLLIERFHFYAEIYEIKSKNSAALLQYEITAFIRNHSLDRRSLTILFYAGHADSPNNFKQPGYSVWRAKQKDGPTLNWNTPPHELMYNAGGDVLVILDCCYAITKTRGFKNGKMEILAAGGSDSRVPAPGRISFTNILVKEIKKHLKSDTDMNIRWLHRHLFSQTIEVGLTVSPAYLPLSEYDENSIILKPLLANGFIRKRPPPSSYVFLRVSLSEDATGSQIARWLKSYLPKTVESIDIEGLVLKARKLETLKDRGEVFTGSILGSLSIPAQEEILHQLRTLSQAVSSTAVMAVSDENSFNDESETAEKSESAQKALNNIMETVGNVRCSIEGGIVLDPTIELDRAAADQLVLAADAKGAITLRQFLLESSGIPDCSEIPREKIEIDLETFSSEGSGFGTIGYGTVGDKLVLLESFDTLRGYERLHGTTLYDHWHDFRFGNIKRVATQLSLTQDENFQVLPCIGYLNDPSRATISIVFETKRIQTKGTNKAPQMKSLGNILDLADVENNPGFAVSPFRIIARGRVSRGNPGPRVIARGRPNTFTSHLGLDSTSIEWQNLNMEGQPSVTNMKSIPLGRRISLAYILAQSLNSFHRVGWVHKGFQSENVMFFQDANLIGRTEVDLTRPYIFGFNYSRPITSTSVNGPQGEFSPKVDVYHHPNRWGETKERFEKSHDVYSLGILLIEIAFWRPIQSSTFKNDVPRHTSPEEAVTLGFKTKRKLLDRVNRDLPHMVGQLFTNAIVNCLTFQERTAGFDDFRMYQEFNSGILEPLKTASIV